ncbi:hypothetical protein M3Y97_00064000 [Aphelenchoides bicaudatus]|nr:hypothetical protein M3Y97_00064000 [Aphelenchoides bicaudatus]
MMFQLTLFFLLLIAFSNGLRVEREDKNYDVVCEQSADSGSELKDFEHDGRFYYDKELKNCLKFSFFGASESFNNFLKYSDYHGLFLSSYFYLHVLTLFYLDCSSPKDSGHSCSDEKEGRFFYFDSKMKVCQPFNHLGCGGTSNKFPTFKECMSACKNVQSDGKQEPKTGHSQWTHADKCGASHLIPDGKYTECRAGRSKCPEHHLCKNEVCCPTKEYVCSLQDDSGTFADGVDDKPRFAWSEEIQSCWRFSYYGAAGNYNSFKNFRDCINFCSHKKA